MYVAYVFLDSFPCCITNQNIIFFFYIADDAFIELVATDTDRIAVHHTAQAQDTDIRSTAANIHYHFSGWHHNIQSRA